MNKANNKNRKNKKSIGYEILISILTFILVGSIVSLITTVISYDTDYTKNAEDIYYHIIETQVYSPFDVYDTTVINRACYKKDTNGLKEIYGYGDYYMDSFYYHGLKDEGKKERYKKAMEEDKENMGELSGLTDRIDRQFNKGEE